MMLEEKTFNKKDLAINKIFDGSELIIEIDSTTMVSIRNQSGTEAGKEYDIVLFRYSLVPAGKKVQLINNGRNEIFKDDKEYQGYSTKLKQVGLWFNN